jgi:POT family proton-dependent oligopeptide transporter
MRLLLLAACLQIKSWAIANHSIGVDLLMIVGSLILAIDPIKFFFFGISFTIVGTGFFKPNISTMVGTLYHEGDPRRDAGFSLFYAGINLGALIGGYLCVAVGKGEMLSSIVPAHLTWNVAFGFAACGDDH